MALKRLEAIILGGRDLGEADRVLSLFTKEEGRLDAVAKGVRRGRSRLAPLLEPLGQVSLILFEGRNLDRITGATSIRGFRRLRENLVLLTVGSYAAELYNLALPEAAPDPVAYVLLVSFLEELGSFPDPELLLLSLEFRFLDLLGYRPELDRCARCGGSLDQSLGYDAEAGGTLCGGCREPGEELSGAARQVMRLFLAEPRRSLRSLRLNPTVRRELRRLLGDSWRVRLGRPPRSLAFLQEVLTPAGNVEPPRPGHEGDARRDDG